MHQVGILGAVRERAKRNRGRVAVFDRLSPRHAAHVVVDLQNGFMDHGQVAEVPMARMIVPNVNRISAALRAAGGTAVYAAHGGCRRARSIETFTPGNPGHALWSALDVAEQDMVVLKRRFGAFVPGSSDLHARLQERGSTRSSFPTPCHRSAVKRRQGMR